MSEIPKQSRVEAPAKETRDEFLAREMAERKLAYKREYLELNAAYPENPEQRHKKLRAIDEMPEEEQLRRLYNNLHCWLPAVGTNATIGMYRAEGAYGSVKAGTKWSDEKIDRRLQLERDVDAFLKSHGLEEVARRVGEAFGKQKTREEMQEQWDLLGELYYFMRQKGYDRKELVG